MRFSVKSIMLKRFSIRYWTLKKSLASRNFLIFHGRISSFRGSSGDINQQFNKIISNLQRFDFRKNLTTELVSISIYFTPWRKELKKIESPTNEITYLVIKFYMFWWFFIAKWWNYFSPSYHKTRKIVTTTSSFFYY